MPVGPTRRRVHFAMWAGILAPALFVSTVVLLAVLNPDYDDSRLPVSAYGMNQAIGSRIMNGVAFGVTGLLVVCFSASFALVLDWSPASVLAILSWFVAGISFMGLGAWPLPHAYHVEFTLYLGILAMVGVATGTWAVTEALKSWVLWSSAAVAELLLITFPGVVLFGQPQFGVTQRFRLGGIGLWMIVAAVHLFAIDREPGNRSQSGAG